MDRKRSKLGMFAFVAASMLAACLSQFVHTQPARHAAAGTRIPKRIPVYPVRQSISDLAVSGMLAGLPDGNVGFVQNADLAALPTVTIAVHGDENFHEADSWHSVRATGIYLDVLAQALGALPGSDLIDANCLDDYRAHYPAIYIASHRPILALTLNRQPPAAWAKTAHQRDPGPYFITHDHFVPAFKVLAHSDRPQVPTGVVRLDFTTIAATYNPIAPRGSFAQDSPERQGFTIARQNCLRCHNQGAVGGLKAGRTWTTLSTWAREQPVYFENYVHNPRDFETHAKMPANLEYDRATLHALTAYFRTFTAAPGGAQGH